MIMSARNSKPLYCCWYSRLAKSGDFSLHPMSKSSKSNKQGNNFKMVGQIVGM